MRKLLLISNSTQHGRGYLEHCGDAIRRILEGRRRVLFVPFALHDRDGYAAKAAERFAALGFELESVHRAGDPQGAVAEAEAVFVGGGNTFRLLDALYERNLLTAIRERVLAGMPYIGSSAGSVIAAPTLKTTNDMPIVQPPSFGALSLIPFQINAHYLDPDPSSTHMGETRETRIREFHEMNGTPVLGIREGSWLEIEGDHGVLAGTTGARLFRRDREAVEMATGASLDELLG